MRRIVADVGEGQNGHRELPGRTVPVINIAYPHSLHLLEPCRLNPIDMNGVEDVLYLLLAVVDEGYVELAPHLMANPLRANDGAWDCQRGKPCRRIDVVSVQVLAIDHDVGEIDAKAKHDMAVKGEALIPLDHA